MGLTPTRCYEDRLGDGLVALLGRKADSLEAFCDGLNEQGVTGPRGERWTPEFLAAELARLEREAKPGEKSLPPPSPVTARSIGERTDGRPQVAEPCPPSAETAEELLATGLLNLWYLVARSSDVTDRPLSIRRLARNLVLWRDAAGKLSVLEDFCPHRGAPLSLGTVVDGDIACPYHGVMLNGEGRVTTVPPTPACPMVGEKTTRSYPAREFAGAVFVYFGDDLHAEPPEPVFPEEVASPEWTSFLYTGVWNVNWQIALDNRTDPIHGSFLHQGTFTLGRGRQDSELEVKPTDSGFETWRNNQKNTNIDWHKVRFHPGNIAWVTTEIPYPPAIGGGFFRINGFPTPIDAETTLVYFFRSRPLTGWRRDLWRFLYNNRLEAHAQIVVEQDRVLLERIALASRKREQLLRSDVAVSRMRRMVREEAQRQLDALKEARG